MGHRSLFLLLSLCQFCLWSCIGSRQDNSRLQFQDNIPAPPDAPLPGVCDQTNPQILIQTPQVQESYFENYFTLDSCFDEAEVTILSSDLQVPYTTPAGIGLTTFYDRTNYTFVGMIKSDEIDTNLLPDSLRSDFTKNIFYVIKAYEEPYLYNHFVSFQAVYPDGRQQTGTFHVQYGNYRPPQMDHQTVILPQDQTSVQVEIVSQGGSLELNKYEILTSPQHGRIENLQPFQRSFTYILEDLNFSGLDTIRIKVYDDATGELLEDEGVLSIRVEPRVQNTNFVKLNQGYYLDGDDNDKLSYYAYFHGNPNYLNSVNTYTHRDGTLYVFADSKRVGKHLLRKRPDQVWEVLTSEGWKRDRNVIPKSLFPYSVTMGMIIWDIGHPTKVVAIVDMNPMAAQEINFDIHNDHGFVTIDLETGDVEHRSSAVASGIGDLVSNFSSENYTYISANWRGSAFDLGISETKNLALADDEALLIGTKQGNFFNSYFMQASLFRYSTKNWVNFKDNIFPAYHNGNSDPIPPQLNSDLTSNSRGDHYKEPLVTYNSVDNAYILTFNSSNSRRASRLDKTTKTWTHWDGTNWSTTSQSIPSASNALAAVTLGDYSFFIYQHSDSILALPYNGRLKKFEEEIPIEGGIDNTDGSYTLVKKIDENEAIILLKRGDAILTKTLYSQTLSVSPDQVHILADDQASFYPSALHLHQGKPLLFLTEKIDGEKSRIFIMGEAIQGEEGLDWKIKKPLEAPLASNIGTDINQFINTATFDYNNSPVGAFYGAQPTGHMSLSNDYLFTTGINVEAAYAFDRNHRLPQQALTPIAWSGWQLLNFPGSISTLEPSGNDSGKIFLIDDLVNSTTNKHVSDIQVWDYEQGLVPVRTYSPDTRSAGQPLRYQETRGLNYAADSAVDPVNKKLYVTEKFSHRIKVYSIYSNYLHYEFSFGEKGNSDGQLHSPEGIDRDQQGNIWVVDSQNHRLQKFSSDGNHLLSIGEKGTAPGEFLNPYSVSVDKKTGKIYVSDVGNHRIQIFDTSGNFVTEWSSWTPSAQSVSTMLPSNPKNHFSDITSVVADNNNVYVGVHNTIVHFKMNFPPLIGGGN